MGNAASKADIDAQLQYMRDSGIGGVCVIPIYGAKGDEANYVKLLSPKFFDAIKHIKGKADSLGMGVDITMGSGWPFGGPWITRELSSKKLSEDMRITSTMFKVKRAAPGGEGLAADPLNRRAYALHASVIKKAFAKNAKDALPRAFFNDSYEYAEANITEKFFEEFSKRRGYNFRRYMRSLFAQSPSGGGAKRPSADMELDADTSQRLWQDYHATIAELVYESMSEYTKACADMGCMSVYQAHGSPGNLIDLYMLSDIPQTESFGPSDFDIPNLRADPDYDEKRFGRPDLRMMKFASSAANLSGKKLVGAEACTWLGNHFRVSPAQAKPEIDKLFLGGINHVFYHGSTYSPMSQPFPGRLFYASTNFNYNAHFSGYFSLLNAFVQRSQKILQNSSPANDVLVYFPIHEFWKSSGGPNHILRFDVHRISEWIGRCPPFERLSLKLLKRGYCYDFVSDGVLPQLSVDDGLIRTKDGIAYKAVVVPKIHSLDINTYEQLGRLAYAGACVIFEGGFPDKAPGLFAKKSTNAQLLRYRKFLMKSLVTHSGDVFEILQGMGIRGEPMAGLGLEFIRKSTPDGALYFISNHAQKFDFGKVEINARARQIEYFDPVANRRGELAHTDTPNGSAFELKLLPGQSCFIFANKKKRKLQKISFSADGQKSQITAPWKIEFVSNRYATSGLKLPESIETKELKSFAELGLDGADSFCGTAKYSAKFDVPSPGRYAIDLGAVFDFAKVKINGSQIATLWCYPFRADIPEEILKAKSNTIEVEVQNSAFNLVRKIAAENPNWNKSNAIVDITYKKFEPQKSPPWPSGLLGEVSLIKLK